MVTTRPPKTIVKPTALGPVANTDTKLLIYGLFQKGRVLAQDGVTETKTAPAASSRSTSFAKSKRERREVKILMRLPDGRNVAACAPQKVGPALIARFKPAIIGCLVPVDPTTPPASYERGPGGDISTASKTSSRDFALMVVRPPIHDLHSACNIFRWR